MALAQVWQAVGVLLARLCLLLLCLSVTLGQRVGVDVAGNLLDPFVMALLPAAALLWLRDGLFSAPGRPYPAVALCTVGPLLALLLLLPLVGVLADGFDPERGYGLTTLYSWVVPGFAIAVLSLSRHRRLHGLRLEQVGFFLIFVHGVYGLGQTLFRLRLVPAEVWQRAVVWDADSQLAQSEAYVISGRSTGLFINANEFGLWSCLAIVFSAVVLRGRQQAVGVALGVVGVVGSQSRTAWLGLAVLAAVVLVRALRDGRAAGRLLGRSAAFLPLLLIGWLLGWLPRLLESDLVTRLTSALEVLDRGVAADRNLLGRVNAWAEAWEFSADYPLGTLGPPQVLLGGFIDNEFVSLFVQGSALLLAAYVLGLLSPLALRRRGVPHADALLLVAALIALFSLTMLPLESFRGAALVWLMAAVAMGGPVQADRHSLHRPAPTEADGRRTRLEDRDGGPTPPGRRPDRPRAERAPWGLTGVDPLGQRPT